MLRWDKRGSGDGETGRPFFSVAGGVDERMEELGVSRLHLSISHDAGVAVAMVVVEG